MLQVVTQTLYRAFGFNIKSDYELPELVTAESYPNQADIKIRVGSLHKLWEMEAKEGQLFVVQPDRILFRIPEVAIYSVTGGSDIVVTPLEEDTDDKIRLYLLGTCMGAIMMQRKILPLHGSALEINGKAYAVVGDSGAGKSTTAAALLKRGCRLVSDDVIPVTFSTNNTPLVTPAYPQQKLWQESLDSFGVSSHHLKPIIDRETKFAVPVKEQFSQEVMPLAGVFEITKGNALAFQPVNKLKAVHTLFLHTYRNFFLEKSGLLEWHFNTTTRMVNQLSMFNIQRPEDRFTADEIADFILSAAQKEELQWQ
ncbi:aldolase [Alteribacter lacisalsi]|uniref:Aldolase n=1 Tax=Alteribacter lacisalsi TaxID=2045244 RepID=A0A2W0H8A6_9BACI|nr:aldolase [Alteribacter lacisalsi]PYZ96966.1 aldolase [Alteribacter lacisalsi]